MKAVRIEQDVHKVLGRISKKHKTSLKGFIELSISYFQRTGLDPREFADQSLYDQSKAIAGIKKQLDFLVRMQKTSEKSFNQPVSKSILALEKAVLSLSKGEGIPVSNSVKELSKISCPNCQKNCQQLEAEISCESCEFSLALQIGNVHFSTEDIGAIMAGGMTRIFDGVEIGERRADGIRFYLDRDCKLRTQKF